MKILMGFDMFELQEITQQFDSNLHWKKESFGEEELMEMTMLRYVEAYIDFRESVMYTMNERAVNKRITRLKSLESFYDNYFARKLEKDLAEYIGFMGE